MKPHESTITIEARQPEQLETDARRRIEFFTTARREDFGAFLFREAARIQAERKKQQPTTK